MSNSGSSISENEKRIELNECSVSELISLKIPRIGIKLATRIINERIENGKFKDWNNVKKRVYGVGIQTIENMKQNLNLSLTSHQKSPKQSIQQPVKKSGFVIEYVDLGPETEPMKPLPPDFKDLQPYMQNNKKKRTLDES